MEDLKAELADMEMKHEASSREAARLKLFASNLEDKLAETSMEMADIKRQHQAAICEDGPPALLGLAILSRDAQIARLTADVAQCTYQMQEMAMRQRLLL